MISVYARTAWLWILVGVGTAQAAVPLAEVTENLYQRLQITDEPQKPWASGLELRQPIATLNQFYSQREYRPAWLDAEGPLPLAGALQKAVAEAEREGLRPADYHSRQLNDALILIQAGSEIAGSGWADLDLLLTDSWLTYASHLLSGRLNPEWAIKARSKDLVLVLQEGLAKGDAIDILAALSPSHPIYGRLRKALADYREIARKGGWPSIKPGPKLALGVRHARVKELRARLRMSGELAGEAAQKGAEELFDENLRQAVRRFQRRHGIRDDGVVGSEVLAELNVPVTDRIRQIEANMERWRWMPDHLGQRYILVNVPDFSLVVMENEQPVMDAKVIVGQAVRQTPVFTANMSYLVLSPRWYVPRSIAVKDKLPQLRRDAYALARQNIRVFDVNGQEIDPGTVDWRAASSNYFPYRLRQDPGPRNALGKVKFMFPNPYNVYLHDTPSHSLFNRSQRTFSSGCIRISKPIELAEYVLRGDPRWNRNAIMASSKGGRQQIVKLPEEIPVHILYWTAWVDEEGAVNFRHDIYNRDKLLKRSQLST